LDSPARSGWPRACPVRGKRPATQDAFHRIATSTRLSKRGPGICAPHLGGFSAKTRTPIRFYVAKDRVSMSGQSRRYRPLTSFELGRDDVVRLTTSRVPRSRCVRPISASQHSTYEYPYPPAPGSIVSCGYPRLRVRNGLRPLRPRNRTFHDARSASGDRLNSARCYRPREPASASYAFAATFPLTPLSPPSLAPCNSAFVGGARCGEGRQIVSAPVP